MGKSKCKGLWAYACHTACACREKKVKELVEAIVRYKNKRGHSTDCLIWNKRDGSGTCGCNCEIVIIEAAIEGVRR